MRCGLQVLWIGAAILLGGPPVAVGQSTGETESPKSTAETAPSSDRCAHPVAHNRCTARCAPHKQIFLPCMAVGAASVAACRIREVAQCEAACAQRHC